MTAISGVSIIQSELAETHLALSVRVPVAGTKLRTQGLHLSTGRRETYSMSVIHFCDCDSILHDNNNNNLDAQCFIIRKMTSSF